MTTANEIWQAYQDEMDAAGKAVPNGVRPVMERYIMNRLVPAMDGLMDEPVTPVSVVQATRAFVQDALQADLIEEIINAHYPQPMPGHEDLLREMTAEMRLEGLNILRDTEQFAEGDDWYRSRGLTDDDVFEEMGMSDENRSAALIGQLTIGQLLASQPGLILILVPLSTDDEDDADEEDDA